MTSRGVMNYARFERSTLDGHMFDRVEGAGLALVACQLLATSFGRVKMSAGSLVGSVVVGGRINGCDLSDADLRGTDLSQTQLASGHGSNTFTGAKYNAQTKFPEGFDPEAEGMVRVADFTPEEEAELMWKESDAAFRK